MPVSLIIPNHRLYLHMIRYATSQPAGYRNAFESYLYNGDSFLRLKRKERHTCYALHESTKTVVALIHFILEKEAASDQYVAVSLPGSPFGSVEFSIELSKETLNDFLTFVKETCQSLGVAGIRIKNCIAAYRPDVAPRLAQALQEQQFVVEETLTNHHIPVDVLPFRRKIHRMEQKRLRKGKRYGFTTLEVPLSEIGFYYRFLQQCRQEKGWHLSMSAHEVARSVQALPEAYRIFAVYDRDQCIAASLAVQVNAHILYDLYHDSLASYKPFSPVVLLLEHMYDYCAMHQIRLLDLGTSPTGSLQQFKARVGGVPSEKITYIWRPEKL